MRKILAVLLLLSVCSVCYPADLVISITVPEAKLETASMGFLRIYPNAETNEDGSQKYTNKQWVAERLRRTLVKDVRRGLQMIANQAAQVVNDDGIAVIP